MPIKLPKGFPRRKSSGNVLDEVQNNQPQNNRDSTSSFRVLARPHSSAKSSDGANVLGPGPGQMSGRAQPQPRPLPKASFEDENEELFSVARPDATNRGSGGTSNSLSTNQYDSGASSTRLSSSSTNPSSVDARSDRNIKPTGQRLYEESHPLPAPPSNVARGNFLKQAGRTFSFGMSRSASRENNDFPPPVPSERSRRGTITTTRERAMTSSSVTTATPPRLDDSSLSIKDADDDFGNMFANLESRSNRDNLTSMHPAPLKSAARAAPPQPIRVNNHAQVESSPYSWNSQNSKDGLIASPSPSRTVIQQSPQPSTLRNAAMPSVRSDSLEDENMFEDATPHRSPEQLSQRLASSPISRAPPSSFPTSAMNRARTYSNTTAPTRTTRSNSADFDLPAIDPTLLAHAQLASKYEDKQLSPDSAQNNKVMTPAEFERYKQQKEDTRRYNKVFGKTDSDEGSGDEYDDEEDDQERERQAVRQRKKQEAHLAVYRQQMMKVTGDTPNNELPRPETSMGGLRSGNVSRLDLSNVERRMSSIMLDGKPFTPGAGKLPADDDDEDEDVPLGILAAHGFPNKNRPPTRLAASSSNPNLRSLAQTQGGASPAGGDSGRGGLPAFARNLPADPYYGASIVQQTERQPLAMHASPSLTHLPMQPQASGAATAHPLHPAGLVGVIAGEERARAMRRGSPNPQPAYDMSTGMPQQQQIGRMPPQMPSFNQGMMGPPPPPPPMFSPTEQAQLHMSQSMTQMMQMQMQWMQHMAGMMGQQSNMNMNMPMMGMPNGQGMLGMPQMMPNAAPAPAQLGSPQVRPQSVPLQGYNGASNQQRTFSTLSPSMAGWTHSSPAVPQIHQNPSVYAPSIAPSERSNVGLASRYRPVSNTAGPDTANWAKRASTFTSSTFRPWANENSHGGSKLATTTVKAIQPADDEDDEKGWAEMKARKEKKQRSWKMRRGGQNTLQELYNAPA